MSTDCTDEQAQWVSGDLSRKTTYPVGGDEQSQVMIPGHHDKNQVR